MRRWNGWGDESNHFPLKPAGLTLLNDTLGKGNKLPDTSLEEALAAIPPSRLDAIPDNLPVSLDPEERLRHARGQSLPDWLAMRAGKPGRVPDAVAFPQTSGDVRALLDWAQQEQLTIIPYGGGTSVAGHINTPESNRPVLVLSLQQMNQLISLDQTSHLARIGAGANGPQVEAILNEKGYTLGHFPQSWELSTLGGWVASRSSGQQSMRYGRIEQLFAGAHVETLKGPLDIPVLPASSAGPDIREMLLGSEGHLGIITEVDVRITPLPEAESFHVAFARNWEEAVSLVRSIVQARLPLSLLRLSNAEETRTQLVLAGHENLVAWLQRYLSVRGMGDEKCMITYGVTGSKRQCKQQLRTVHQHLRQGGAVNMGKLLGKKWEESRFRSPYLRHGLWEGGFAVDTLETCVTWDKVTDTMTSIEAAIKQSAPDGLDVHVFTHLSHLYRDGSSIYTTYIFRNGDSYDATYNAWKQIKTAASDAIADNGGTISHQHGVGRDHAPWLPREKGRLGMMAIRQLAQGFDPDSQLNPGCLFDEQSSRNKGV